jgi:hypothetical protein
VWRVCTRAVVSLCTDTHAITTPSHSLDECCTVSAVHAGIDFSVNASVLLHAANGLVSSGLKDMGYTYVLIDDGWPACAQFNKRGGCQTPTERLEDGTVIIDEAKFPPSAPGANDGIKIVADKLHAQGFKLGIYTAPHGQVRLC